MKRSDYVINTKKKEPVTVKAISPSDIPADHQVSLYLARQPHRVNDYDYYSYDGDIFVYWKHEANSHRKFLRHWTDMVGDKVLEDEPAYDILCLCGNNRFILKYGSYEIFATCICGRSESVYS